MSDEGRLARDSYRMFHESANDEPFPVRWPPFHPKDDLAHFTGLQAGRVLKRWLGDRYVQEAVIIVAAVAAASAFALWLGLYVAGADCWGCGL